MTSLFILTLILSISSLAVSQDPAVSFSQTLTSNIIESQGIPTNLQNVVGPYLGALGTNGEIINTNLQNLLGGTGGPTPPPGTGLTIKQAVDNIKNLMNDALATSTQATRQSIANPFGPTTGLTIEAARQNPDGAAGTIAAIAQNAVQQDFIPRIPGFQDALNQAMNPIIVSLANVQDPSFVTLQQSIQRRLADIQNVLIGSGFSMGVFVNDAVRPAVVTALQQPESTPEGVTRAAQDAAQQGILNGVTNLQNSLTGSISSLGQDLTNRAGVFHGLGTTIFSMGQSLGSNFILSPTPSPVSSKGKGRRLRDRN